MKQREENETSDEENISLNKRVITKEKDVRKMVLGKSTKATSNINLETILETTLVQSVR